MNNTEKSKYLAGKMDIPCCNLYTAEGRQVLLTTCLDKDKGIFWDAFTKWFGKRKGFSGRNIQQKVMAHFFVFIPELADAVYAYLKEGEK